MERAESTLSSSEKTRSTEIVLGVLNAIDRDENVTQRSVARDLDIALGLANTYLKRCVRKGLIKMREAPARRYAYYLTRKGFAEKARLTAEYLSSSFGFFRQARRQMTAVFDEASKRGYARLALIGGGDLAEIAMLCARESKSVLVAVIDGKASGAPHGVPLLASLKDAGTVDAVIITDLRSPQRAYSAMVEAVGAERVLAPALLGLRRERGPS